MRTVTTYDVISRTAVKSLPCPACGKKLRRQRTFEMTLSPFNRNPDGTPRSRAEIWVALGVLADEWRVQPETHPKCAGPA